MPSLVSVGQNPAASPEWTDLETQFGATRLVGDEIYALPMALIHGIRKHAPSIFTEANYQFETALRQAAGTGFRDRQPFGCPIVDARHKDEVASTLFGDPRHDVMRDARLGFHAAPRTYTAEKRTNSSGQPLEEPSQAAAVAMAHKVAAKIREIQLDVEEDVLTHQCGYMGWLLTNASYQSEQQRLRQLWVCQPHLASSYPTREIARQLFTFGRDLPPNNDEELTSLHKLKGATMGFLDKWGLDGLLTWKLPILSAPMQLTYETNQPPEPAASGITLFLPWSLLGSRELNLAKIIEYHQNCQDLSHLDGWLFDTRQNGWGVARFGKLVPLYVYLHLALRRRYPDRLAGHTTALDRAFAEYLSETPIPDEKLDGVADNVRKMREKMEQRLDGKKTDRRSSSLRVKR